MNNVEDKGLTLPTVKEGIVLPVSLSQAKGLPLVHFSLYRLVNPSLYEDGAPEITESTNMFDLMEEVESLIQNVRVCLSSQVTVDPDGHPVFTLTIESVEN